MTRAQEPVRRGRPEERTFLVSIPREPPAAAGSAEAPDAPREPIPGFVQEALSELRARNALVIAWIHVGVRAALWAVFTWVAVATSLRFYALSAWINAVFLVASLAVLELLRRRIGTPFVIRALVVLDLVSLAIGGWRFTGSLPPPQAALAVGVIVAMSQLVLLAAGLILAGRDLVATGVVAALLTLAFCTRARVPQPFYLLLLIAVVGFSVIAIWAARRIVRLAIQEALVAYSANAFRTHRDELDAANQRIRESQIQAEALTQLVVHDLKNPLTVVMAHLSVVHQRIAELPELAEEAEDLSIAREEGARLAGMIGDLLLISRLEKGELPVQPECVGVGEILGQAARGLQAIALAKRVRLEVEAASDLFAPLDPGLFRRLLENLLSNAVRHTRAGDRIQISAWPDGGALHLAVRNTGPAIAEFLRGRLFEKHATGGRGEWHNVGLGLYACRLVAEAHGGRIALVDCPGWNVCFEAALPAGDCPLGLDEEAHVGLLPHDQKACSLLRRKGGG